MRKLVCCVVALGVVLAAGSASAVDNGVAPKVKAAIALTPTGGWQSFSWNGAVPIDSSDNPISFTLTDPGYLTVTDGYLDGDQFEVYDGATLLGTTSTPANDGKYGPGPDYCLIFPEWSKGTYELASGYHEINIRVVHEAVGYTDGAGFVRVDYQPYRQTTIIPVFSGAGLAALALLLGGLGVLALRRD